jgi:hypothetical protein
MYEGVIFVGGKIANLGNDAIIEKPDSGDLDFIQRLLTAYNVPGPSTFQKVISGRKLWNFDRKELATWKAAL